MEIAHLTGADIKLGDVLVVWQDEDGLTLEHVLTTPEQHVERGIVVHHYQADVASYLYTGWVDVTRDDNRSIRDDDYDPVFRLGNLG